MRGSEIDKCLKNSIILELATKGGTDFILPDGTFKLMADKYKVKVDTQKDSEKWRFLKIHYLMRNYS